MFRKFVADSCMSFKRSDKFIVAILSFALPGLGGYVIVIICTAKVLNFISLRKKKGNYFISV